MKMKFVRNGRTKRRELLVASQRGELLDVKSADKLADDPSSLLLGLAYEKQKGSGNVILHYDVEGLWSLQTYLSKRALSVEELMGLLEATERVFDICAEVRLRSEGLLFDPKYIFVDAQCCPHFALIVLEDVPFQARNSPLMLLGAMTAEHVRYATPDATGLARRIGGLVVDLEGVFSLNRFRRFLENERRQSDAGVPEMRHGVAEPGSGSVWATAGGGAQGTSAAGDANFFWSPLAGMAEERPPAAEGGRASGQQGRSHSVPTDEAAALDDSQRGTSAPARDAAVMSASQPAPAPAPQQVAVPAPQATPDPQPVRDAPAVPAAHPAPVPQPAPAVPATPTPAPSTPAAPAVAQPAPSGGICLVRPATGERFDLPLGQQVQAGRGSGCAIRLLGNRKLSRVHVALTNTGQMVMVSDVGAVNGVFVGGQRLGAMQSVLVTAGQGIRLADEDFMITAS